MTDRKAVESTGEPDGDQPRSPVEKPRWLVVAHWAKRPVMAAAAVGAVLSGLAGYWTTYRTVAAVSLPATGTHIAPAMAPLSILVLPFANQTGDEAKTYIADSLTTTVTADLSRIRDAFVAPVATGLTYQNKRLTVQQIGTDAGVRFVLAGSVMANGDKLRITAQLADTQSGAQLWNEIFEGEMNNLFALQDQVTTRIGNSIGDHMVIAAAAPSELHRSTSRTTDLLMRARALILRPQSVKNFQEIENLYRRALVQEPGNLVAMAGLASTLAIHAIWLDPSDAERKKKMLEARNLALKVKDIEPENLRVYVPLSIVAMENNDFDAARRAHEAQLESTPKNPSVLNNFALYFREMGEPEKAIPLLERALAVYPKGADVIFDNLGSAYLEIGNNDAAIHWLLKAIDTGTQLPDAYANLAIAYSNSGDALKSREYVSQYKKLVAITGYKSIDENPLPPQAPEALKKYYRERFVPEWKKAGLP